MGTMESGDEGIQGNEERIYVSVRLRPLNDKEILRNDVSDWECINDNTIVYKSANLSASERLMYPSVYVFDSVFRTDSATREVYEQGARDVALSVLSGMNSSVFAYGQTSSGKTFTMTGITEYAIEDVYKYIQKHPEREFVLKFSAMEIYNESVRDLLSFDSTPLRLLDDPERGTIVEKLTEEILRDWNHMNQLLSVCEAQRRIGETSLNETSSRSHQIIRLTVDSISREFLGKDNPSTLTATVNFVDLAGSERASQSLSAGTRLKEGCHINRSLLTLGTVIRKLSKGRNGHIPYRDSKLTRILQTSLGGNARTAIICTMSPARSHVEQSRNTLLFAGCAKEVRTNAQVNVVMSDKALIKHLQSELARLESQLRSPQSTAPSNHSALFSQKDLQIEKLEKEIKELILQRDIAQSQVRDLLQMLGDDEQSAIRVGLGNYPHLRVQKSPEGEIQEQESSILADPHSLDVDNKTFSDGLSRTSSEDHFAKIPYFNENFESNNATPRILISSSNFNEGDSSHGWEDIEKRSNGTLEDLCREVRCIETEKLSDIGSVKSSNLHSEENNGFSEVILSVNGDRGESKSPSPPLGREQEPPLKGDNELKADEGFRPIPLKKTQEKISSSLNDIRESIPPMFKKGSEVGSIHFLDIASLEKLSLTHELATDSSVSRSLKLTRSRSCTASMVTTDSASPWFKIVDYNENTSSMGSEREKESFERKIPPINFNFYMDKLSTKDSHCSPENTSDIEIGAPYIEFSTAEDFICCSADTSEKTKLPTEKESVTDPANSETEPKVNQSSKKDVKDVGLDPMEEEFKGLSSWPTEFKRLRREIIDLWHDCNVSLVHRTYFFLLFQGDPLDAIYMEVEMRRMKFLKEKFSRGEKTIVNGQCLTLASSSKDLSQERRKLSKQMEKKLSEQEREMLFLKWGIGINTKLRKLQLAHRLWCSTDDMNHIYDSALLVARLVGLIESGHSPKEMFGLNFTPRRSERTYTFKRSLVSLF
ncbi:kinesin-like protein KIN-7E [Primulina eburnea]|uniref:kinesin-like protein KIN-7E n=1 Tax=Primulina eburnea TaxID=1245227 RepID=UPI003C6CA8CF